MRPPSPTCCGPISGTHWRRCAASGIFSAEVHHELRDAYDFLRTVEDRLRLIHNRGVSELPESTADLERLARRLSDEKVDPGRAVEAFLAEAARVTHRTRELFEQIVIGVAQMPI